MLFIFMLILFILVLGAFVSIFIFAFDVIRWHDKEKKAVIVSSAERSEKNGGISEFFRDNGGSDGDSGNNRGNVIEFGNSFGDSGNTGGNDGSLSEFYGGDYRNSADSSGTAENGTDDGKSDASDVSYSWRKS